MPEKECAYCGAPFTPTNNRQKFCRPQHERASQDQKPERKARPKRGKPKPCACGLGFVSRGSAKCWECHAFHGQSCPMPWRICVWCGRTFYSKRKHKYCGPVCERSGHPYASLMSPIEYGKCHECGCAFIRRQGGVGRYCGDECGERARKRDNKHLRRSKTQQGERFTIHEVGERDGWKCHLCGKPVDPSRRGQRNTDASIDHLIPLSQGGSHTRSNVALAHRICNSKRGTQGIAQLRLVA